MVLELLGQRAVAVDSGVAALAALRAAYNTEAPFSLAMVDIGMPTMSGYELVRTVRREAAGTLVYVVALTGWVSPSDRASALEAGFDAHLSKPVDLAELRALLERAGAKIHATH